MTRKPALALLLLAVLLGVAGLPARAEAQTFTLKKVAAVGDSAPDDGDTFAEFLGAPSLDRGQVAFRAVALGAESGRLGVFRSDQTGGGLATALDTNTLIPGSAETFANFSALSLDGGQVAVIGFGSDLSSGVYLQNGPGGPTEIARTGTLVTPIQLNSFFDLSLSQGKVAFIAEAVFEDIIFNALVGGDATALVELVPGAVFGVSATCCVSLDAGLAVFAVDDPVGVFSAVGGSMQTIADPATTIDGSLFTTLDRPAVHNGRVVFTAASLVRQGVFVHDSGAFSVIADTATPVPGGTGNFTSFSQPSIHAGAVAFVGCGSAGCGVYTTLSGTLAKVIATGDQVGDKTVSELEMGREGVSCSSVAFKASFTDGTAGVYRADLDGGAGCARGLDTVTTLTVWGGLKSSDDQGTAFDVRAEVRLNGALIAAGETACVTGLTRNPQKAQPIQVHFPSFDPADVEDGDELSLTVLARIGTDGKGERCTGAGATHASAAGLRVYFGSLFRPSAFGVGLAGATAQTVYLHSDGPACLASPGPAAALSLDESSPTALLARCTDSPAVAFRRGNWWQPVGTWSLTLPVELSAASPALWWERFLLGRAR